MKWRKTKKKKEKFEGREEMREGETKKKMINNMLSHFFLGLVPEPSVLQLPGKHPAIMVYL